MLFPAWARYVYKYNVSRFAQFARRVWDVVDDNDEIAAQRGIEAMSEFFKALGMPTTIKEFGVPSDASSALSELCTFNRTRTIKSQITLGYQEIKEIFDSCYC